MPKTFKVLAEKYDQVNEIGFAPGMSPKDDPKYILNAKQTIWDAVLEHVDEEGRLALPNGDIIDSYEILLALKKAKTFEQVEKVLFDYGLDYFIHSNPE